MLWQLVDQSRAVTLRFLQGLEVPALIQSKTILDNLPGTQQSNNPLRNNLQKNKELLHRHLGQQKRDSNNQSRNLKDENSLRREEFLEMIKDKPIQSDPLQEHSDRNKGNNLYLLEGTYLLENLQDVGQMIQRLNKRNIVKMNKSKKNKKSLFLIKNHLKKKINQ